MKRFLAILLVLVLACVCFCACAEQGNPQLDKAADYLKAMYKENEGSVTPVDYTMVSAVNIDGVTYNITWTADVEGVKVSAPADGMVTIDIDEKSPAEVNYTLTATLADEKGKTASVTFKYILPKYEEFTISQALAAEDGTLITVSGQVCLINTAYSADYDNISVTIKDADGNELYIYRLSGEVQLGDLITVKGNMATYNGARQVAQGATAEITGHEDIVLEYPEKTIPEVLAADDNTLVTVKGTVKTVDGAWSDDFGNMNVTIVDEAGNELYLYRLETKVDVGDILTVKGIVGSYNGKKQIAQGGTAEITGHVEITVDYPEKTFEEAIAADDDTLLTVKGIVVEINGEWNSQYNNMNVTIWDGTTTLYLYRLGTQVALGDKLVVEGKVGSYNGAKQIVSGTAEIDGQYAESTIADAKAAADGTLVKVSGTVKSVDGEWSEQYGNMNVTIADEAGNELYLFRLGTKVEAGNALVVYGEVSTYNEAKQLKAGLAQVVEASSGELEGGATEGETGEDTTPAELPEGAVKVTKTIAELSGGAWDASGNMAASPVALDSVASFSIAGGNNSGRFYTDHLRIYSTDDPAGTLTVSVAAGYKLVSVKVNCIEIGSEGFAEGAYLNLSGNTTDNLMNTDVAVEGSSVTFKTVRIDSNGKQVRMLGIEVVYVAE